MIAIPMKVKVVVTVEAELYRTNKIGFSAGCSVGGCQVTDYTFDLALVKAHKRTVLLLGGDLKPAVWVELENSHDVCFLGDYDAFERMFNEVNSKDVIVW